ncbi:ribonuclease T2 family protein [Pseudodonghicola sp.]|uniref:ribonuclease T2 family protein n=1 Tax=Pseudodonghicola sp. TaxID=1969463 RepID=UPI003A9789D5
MRWILLWLLTAVPVLADSGKPGQFDYYVLSLSWSPNWCATEGRSRNSEQCDARRDYGWVLHGLWPQYHRGWPEYCHTAEIAPTRRMTAEMTDIMGTPGLAWYQWKKHGVCSGLSAPAYYALAREAYGRVNRPAVFRRLKSSVKLPASVVEEAFLKANPGLTRDMVTVTCQQGYIQEVRICLSRDLQPVPCGRDVIADCKLTDALLEPIP